MENDEIISITEEGWVVLHPGTRPWDRGCAWSWASLADVGTEDIVIGQIPSDKHLADAREIILWINRNLSVSGT